MGSNWDKQWVNDDGTVNANYYIAEVGYEECHRIYSREPEGDKYDLPAVVKRVDRNFVVFIDDRAVALLPSDWTRLTSKIDAVGLPCTANIKWRAYDEPPRFMLNVTIRNA
jgi:hypothetical protein